MYLRTRPAAVGALALSVAIAACLAASAPARAQGEEERPAESARSRIERLAEEFSDPLTTLPQLFLQDAYTPANFGTSGQANRIIARILIPRVPKFSLLPFVQLIRPSFSIVTAPTGRGSTTRTGLGDLQLFDLFVLPWSSKQSGLYMGVGPILVFPTATDPALGLGSWQAGPAFAAIYKGIPGILAGFLVQNPISFAYTSPDRPSVSTLLFQPVLLAYLGRGFYVKSADSTWTMSWRRGTATLLPLSLGIGYVRLREDAPPINVFASGEWMAYRQNAPAAPQTTVRLGVTVAFPDWRPW